MAKDEPQSYGSGKERLSDEQLAENVEVRGQAVAEDQAITKVTDEVGGAKRGGFFKDRDYQPKA